jgi:hypothetical protein
MKQPTAGSGDISRGEEEDLRGVSSLPFCVVERWKEGFLFVYCENHQNI